MRSAVSHSAGHAKQLLAIAPATKQIIADTKQMLATAPATKQIIADTKQMSAIAPATKQIFGDGKQILAIAPAMEQIITERQPAPCREWDWSLLSETTIAHPMCAFYQTFQYLC